MSANKRIASIILLAAAMSPTCGRTPDPLPGAPSLFLWAWERPEHLGFLDPKTVGVAFLARRISWRDGRTESRPRYQALEVPPAAAMIAVTRLDALSPPLPAPDSIVRDILQTAALPRVRAIQIDFDARQSEREWYAQLLRSVRQGLPPSTPLTITALTSWCRADPWIRNLPIADAIPMLFQMGPRASHSTTFPVALCRASLGIATDEIPARLPRNCRIFVFSPSPWTPEAVKQIRQRLHL